MPIKLKAGETAEIFSGLQGFPKKKKNPLNLPGQTLQKAQSTNHHHLTW